MSHSLRAEITHFFKKGKITRPEYDWFMKKAYGHDDVIKKVAYQQGRAEIIDELLNIKDPCENCYMEFCESCNHNGEYSANIQAKLEQLKEQKNEQTIYGI